jgi:putative ABC transport system permease protein
MPDWAPHLRGRLTTLRLSPAREAEIVEELSQHLDERYDEMRAEGIGAEEARQVALEELMEPDALATRMRSLRQARTPTPVVLGSPPGAVFSDLRQDLAYAARTLRRQPGFVLVAVLTLALGIGANAAIFGLVDAALLRPLPFPGADRFVMIWGRDAQSPRGFVSAPDLTDWSGRSRAFDVVAGFRPGVGGMVMSGGAGSLPETVSRQWVTAGFFDVLGVRPIAGRTFLASDDTRRSKVVVLSEGFWRTRFAGDAGIVGRDIRLDGASYTVVGVVPASVQLLRQTSLWALMPIQGAPPGARAARSLGVIGRLKSGVTIDAAESDLRDVADALAREYPATNTAHSVALEPLHDALVGADLRRTAMLFLGAVGVVLLVCCANVANLLLARASVRDREMAIRSALGAGRGRVVRQMLTESLLLSAAGGLLGLAVGAAILRAAPSVVPHELLPAAVTLSFDWRVAAFSLVTAVMVGLAFGAAPAWRASRLAPAHVMAADARTGTGGGGRLRALLVGAEVATAVVLLSGGGLLLRSLIAVERVDRGYGAEDALTMLVDPLGSKYPTPAAILQFFAAVEEEVRGVAGVRGVAWATTLPLGDSSEGLAFFDVVGDPPAGAGKRPSADYQIVSSSYFQTLEVPVVAGRAFDDRDTLDRAPVCMVSEAFARAHAGGRSPVGLRLAIRFEADDKPVVREIVGVARQVKGRPDETQDLLQVYVPLAQDPVDDVYLIVRPKKGPAETLTAGVRAAIARVDKEQLVSVRDVMTTNDIAWDASARHRFRALLVMTFALLALVLAMAGVFGVIAYSVQQRTRDFGIRKALGASTRDILGLVALGAARTIGAGLAVGLALSAGVGRLLGGMLFGVGPLDPVTYVLVPTVLTLTGLVAVAAPAWRASRIDPAVSLRSQ